MQIIDMGTGPKIAYTCDGLFLSFAGGLAFDLDAETQDVQRVFTIYLDEAGASNLDGGSYAAVLILPPRRYAEPPDQEATPLQFWPIPNSETSE